MRSSRLEAAFERARTELLGARAPQGYWRGELSSSALSTATAVVALALVNRESSGLETDLAAPIEAGLQWLSRQVNPDGGWGDTDRSLSNLSTTVLCWAAFGAVPGADARNAGVVARAEQWLRDRAGGAGPDRLASAVIARYGTDRTFSVPILTMCALAGRLGAGRAAWRHVIPLPFELAACPARWFAWLRLPVVSYALPALIAIGQASHHHCPSANPVIRALRNLSRERTLRILTGIQPTSGGFLEATPLTSFVIMSLAGSGQAAHPVTRRGLQFLVSSQRPDGSWPIDSDLATWLTTLSVEALGSDETWESLGGGTIGGWLRAQQGLVEHPYTQAAPGGWAWTDLPGGVPDADDTAGALLALRTIGPLTEEMRRAGCAGVEWLLGLQNSDGGIPTFCRGWGTLPFDRSSADITAHVLRAWLVWRGEFSESARIDRALDRALNFLYKSQRGDGAWIPLWFGNERAAGELNPTYGTVRVLRALGEVALMAGTAHGTSGSGGVSGEAGARARARAAGVQWLLRAQGSDGGWGGDRGVGPSVEETALAVEVLAGLGTGGGGSQGDDEAVEAALRRGAEWLVGRVERGEWRVAAPIGFYFAKLWYYERLYPLIFTVAALRRVKRLWSGG